MLMTTIPGSYANNVLMPKTWIICRICNGQHEVMFDLFEKVSNYDIWLMLRDCGGVYVRKNDNLPDKICAECLKGLWECNKFRLKCQRGHRYLINVLLEGNFNLHEEQLEKEKAACSDVVKPPKVESVDAKEPLKNEILSTANPESNISEQDANIKHYCIVKNENSDKDEEKRIVLLLKLKNDIEKTEKSKKVIEKTTKRKSETQTKLKTKPSRKRSNNSIKTSQKPKIVRRNPEVCIKQPKKDNEKPRRKSKSKLIKTESKFGLTKSGNKTRTRKFLRSKTNFTCKICKKKCKGIIALRQHKYTHLKPYKCNICGKSFSQTHAHMSHYNTHTHEKPFNCRFCQLKFTDRSNRNKHERNEHEKEKRAFTCKDCNKKFQHLIMFEKHLNTHKGHKCKICDKELSCKQALQSHHQRKHLRKLEKEEK